MGGSLEDATLGNDATEVNRQSNPYPADQQRGYSEQEMAAQEQRDNAQLSERRSELEALQRQKPPEKQDELVEYLMKRLKAAEASIQVCEDVIESERGLRKESSRQMKEQIKELQDLVQLEKRSLSDKVSAELDYTLKQAVREKVEIKKQLEGVNEAKEKLQREYDDLVDMYNALK